MNVGPVSHPPLVKKCTWAGAKIKHGNITCIKCGHHEAPSVSETLAALLERAWNSALVSDNLFRSPGPTCYLSDSKDQHEGVAVSLSFNAQYSVDQMNSRLICMVRTKLGEKQTPKSGAPMHFQNLHLLSSLLHACSENFCIKKFWAQELNSRCRGHPSMEGFVH